MIINLETKFNVGDMVFPIAEESLHNDWYSTETFWRVKTENDYDDDSDNKPLKISTIKVDIKSKSVNIRYNIDFSIYKEKEVFSTYKEAQEECNRLNYYWENK